MTRKVWLIHAEDEPSQGPYWSKRVSILARQAEREGYVVQSLSIDRAEKRSFPKEDLFFYRITHRSVPRLELRDRIEALNGGFLFNRYGARLGNKLAFYRFASLHQFPIPPTCSDREWERSNTAPFSGPYLIKKSLSSQGKGIVRIYDQAQVIQHIHKIQDRCVVQQLQSLSPVSDIRLLMVGQRVVGAMRRVVRDSTSGEFRANLSLGHSQAEFYTPPKNLIDLAQDFMRSSKLDFAGLDFIKIDGRFLFLESNLSPGLEGISNLDDGTPQRVLDALYQRAVSQ